MNKKILTGIAALLIAFGTGYYVRGSDAEKTKQKIIEQFSRTSQYNFLLANSPTGSLEGMKYHILLSDAYKIAISHLKGDFEDVSETAIANVHLNSILKPSNPNKLEEVMEEIRDYYGE